MLKNINRLIIALLVLGIMHPGWVSGEPNQQKADKKTRETVHYMLTIELQDGIERALSEPIEIIREKLLKNIEQKNGIQIDRTSMVKVDKCLHDLLTSIPHLAKISTGNTIIRAAIELNAGTSQKSVWTKWKTRKLESPELKMTLFYKNKTVEPTEITCSGYKYH